MTFGIPHADRKQRFNAVLDTSLLITFVLYSLKDLWLKRNAFSIGNADNFQCHFPFFSVLMESLKQTGRLNPWNEFIWGGLPSVGSPNVSLSPFVYLAMHLTRPGFVLAMNAHLVLEHVLAATGTYTLFRCLKFQRVISLAAGALCVCSSSATMTSAFYGTFFHFAMIPWVLVILLTQTHSTVRKNILLLGLVLFWQITYGQLQMTLASIYFYFLFCLWIFREQFSRRRVVQCLGGGVLLGLLLASYTLMPLIETLHVYHGRSFIGWQDLLSRNRVSPYYLINLLLPHVFWGNGSWYPVWKDGATLWEAFEVFVSTPFFLLFSFGLFASFFSRGWREKPFRRLAIFSCAIVFLVTTKSGLVILSALNLFRDIPHGRIVHFLLFPILLLAAHTLQSIIDSHRQRIVFIGYLLAAAVGLFFFLQEPIFSYFLKSLAADVGVPLTETLENSIRDHLKVAHTLLRERLLLMAWLTTLLLVWICGQAYKRIRFVCLLLVLVTGILETYYYQSRTLQRGFELYPYTKLLNTESPFVAYLKQTSDLDSYFFYYATGLRETETGLYPNENALHEIPSINGYTNIVPRISGLEPPYFRANEGVPFYSENLLKLFSIKYILVKKDLSDMPAFYRDKCDSVLSDSKYTLLRYSGALPKAFFPKKVEALLEPDTLNMRLQAASFDPMEKSWVVSKKAETYNLPHTSVCSPHYRQGKPSANSDRDYWITNDCPSLVKMAITVPSHPWWHLFQNGIEVPKREINLVQHLIEIPPGLSYLELRYIPLSYYIGLCVSGLSFILIAILCLQRSLYRMEGGRTFGSVQTLYRGSSS